MEARVKAWKANGRGVGEANNGGGKRGTGQSESAMLQWVGPGRGSNQVGTEDRPVRVRHGCAGRGACQKGAAFGSF